MDTQGNPTEVKPRTATGIVENNAFSSGIVDSKDKKKKSLELLGTTPYRDAASKERKIKLRVRERLNLGYPI